MENVKFNKKLLLITVGSVQKYISSSRKTVDVYASSSIISNIIKDSKNIVKGLEKDSSIVFPNINDDKISSIPNFIIYIIKNKINEIKLREEIYESIYKRLGKSLYLKVVENNDEIRNQLKETFNIFIVQVDIKDDGYERAYSEIMHKLGAIKNIYNFEQINEASVENDNKCTLCGKWRGLKKEYILNTQRKMKNKIDNSEKLCYSCLFKRVYEDEEQSCKEKKYPSKYPSTVELSVLSWIKRGNREKKFICYKNEIQSIEKNENLTESVAYKDELKSILKKNNIENKSLEKKLDDLYLGGEDKPSKYFAVIKIDIDNLGKWLSGKYKLLNEIMLESYQRHLSEAISQFGEKIKDYMKSKEKGKAVYAGGDDILLFTSVDYIFDILEEIDLEFKQLRDCDAVLNYSSEKLTISKSVLIAHYKIPLEKILKTVSKNLEVVKEKYDYKENDNDDLKNGTVFTFITGSAGIQSFYYKNNGSVYKNLKYMIKCFKEGLSQSFIYDLYDILKIFDYQCEIDDLIQNKDIIKSQISRLVSRKKLKVYNKEEEQNYRKKLVELISDVLIKNQRQVSRNSYYIDFNNALNFLYIARHIAKEIYEGVVNGWE